LLLSGQGRRRHGKSRKTQREMLAKRIWSKDAEVGRRKFGNERKREKRRRCKAYFLGVKHYYLMRIILF
jgi:hypothetical protein